MHDPLLDKARDFTEIPREQNLGLCSGHSDDRGVAMCCESGLAPLNWAFSVSREGTLHPVRSTRTRVSPFERCPSAVRSDVVAWQAVPERVQEVSKAGITKCDGRSVNR